MASHKDSICGIEIGKSLITIAQYFPEEQAIGSVVVKPFDGTAADDGGGILGNELKNCFENIECTSRKVVVSLPSEFAVVKVLSLDADEKNVREAVHWELSQHIIGAIEDYAFDYESMSHDGRAAVRQYIAVAYRRSAIERFISLFKAQKLNLWIVDLDMFAVINSFEANYRERKSVPSLIILGTEEKSKIILTREGTLIDYEVLVYDGGPMTPEDYAMRVGEYCSHLCAPYMREMPDIYCSGALFSQTEFVDSLARQLGRVEILNPFQTIQCLATKGENDVTEFAAQLAVAVGLALRGHND